jgi:hypothetical protein
VFTATGQIDIPGPSSSTDCQSLQTFLQVDSKGKAYAAKNGGTRKALQNFIVTGPKDGPKILFVMAFAAIFFGCINAAREIVKEAPIYRRERAINIGIRPYLFSKFALLGGLCLLQSAVLVAAVSINDPFPHGILLPGWLEVYITLALSSLAGLMMGLTISALVSSEDRATIFASIVLLPQILLPGTLFPLKDGALQILAALCVSRWSMAALGSSVGLHSDKLGGDKLFGTDTYHGTLFSIYSQANATQHLLLMWLVLGAMVIILGCIIGGVLKWKDKHR